MVIKINVALLLSLIWKDHTIQFFYDFSKINIFFFYNLLTIHVIPIQLIGLLHQTQKRFFLQESLIPYLLLHSSSLAHWTLDILNPITNWQETSEQSIKYFRKVQDFTYTTGLSGRLYFRKVRDFTYTTGIYGIVYFRKVWNFNYITGIYGIEYFRKLLTSLTLHSFMVKGTLEKYWTLLTLQGFLV